MKLEGKNLAKVGEKNFTEIYRKIIVNRWKKWESWSGLILKSNGELLCRLKFIVRCSHYFHSNEKLPCKIYCALVIFIIFSELLCRLNFIVRCSHHFHSSEKLPCKIYYALVIFIIFITLRNGHAHSSNLIS